MKRRKPSAKKSAPKNTTRLNKYIAHAGICSRREADMHIGLGVVKVNNKVVTELGYQVQEGDVVHFDGKRITPEKKAYVLLNKPKGFITTTKDERGRKTVMDLVAKSTPSRIVPVGRLDRPTTGLLLFTNDGDLAKKLYNVVLSKSLKPHDLAQIRRGFTIDDGPVKVDEVSYVQGASKREIGLEIHSGRNRIVRRIFEHLGYEVIALDRVVFAGLTKKDLPRGTWRHLTKQEIDFLKML
jgi:23S rRNA pseudouridine2605 synthase